jgi:hypothetical protein
LLPDPPEARADEQLFPRLGGHFQVSSGSKDSLVTNSFLQKLQNNTNYVFLCCTISLLVCKPFTGRISLPRLVLPYNFECTVKSVEGNAYELPAA